MGDRRQGDMRSSRHKDGGETQGDKDAGVAKGWDGTQRDGVVSTKNSSTYYSCAFRYMTLGNLQS